MIARAVMADRYQLVRFLSSVSIKQIMENVHASITDSFDMKLTGEQEDCIIEKYAVAKHDIDEYDGVNEDLKNVFVVVINRI